jgi:hypothetical protein
MEVLSELRFGPRITVLHFAFAHISTGTTVDKAIDVDDSKSRGVAPATALTMIGADIETGGAAP